MKKYVLSAAVMASFGSTVAVADFGPEVEGDNSGNINIGGEITQPKSTWKSSINRVPGKLNSATPATIEDWKSVGGSGYEMLISDAYVTLVVTRTLGNAQPEHVVPVISFTGKAGELTFGKNDPLSNAKTIELAVTFEDGDHSVASSDVVAKLDLQGRIAATWTAKETPDLIETFRQEGPLGLAAAQSLETSAQLNNIHYFNEADNLTDTTWYKYPELLVTASLSEVIGSTKAILNTTRATKPTGKWQAKMPITITYQ